MYQTVSSPDIAHPVVGGGGGGDILPEYHIGITTTNSPGVTGSGFNMTDNQETKAELRHKSLAKNPTLDHPHYYHQHQTSQNQHDSPVPLKGSSSSSTSTSNINEYMKMMTTAAAGGGRNHHHVSPSRTSNNNCSSNSGDVLLQWGQRKRSRCVRTFDHKSPSLISSPSPPPQTHFNSMLPPPIPVAPPSGFLNSSRVVSGCISGSLPSKTTRSTVGRRSIVSSPPVAATAAADNHDDHSRKISSSLARPGPPTTTTTKNERLGQFGKDSVGGVISSSENNGIGGGGERIECPRIYISLSRKEKEDDFYAMKGTKLPHRPKKRSKPVERSLQYVFPGLWLSDLTRSKYEVRERKCVKKQQKRRGLKGLESMDSESD